MLPAMPGRTAAILAGVGTLAWTSQEPAAATQVTLPTPGHSGSGLTRADGVSNDASNMHPYCCANEQTISLLISAGHSRNNSRSINHNGDWGLILIAPPLPGGFLRVAYFYHSTASHVKPRCKLSDVVRGFSLLPYAALGWIGTICNRMIGDNSPTLFKSYGTVS